MAQHIAAILTEKGKPLEIQSRATPTPGPGEALVTVHAVALNPVDGLRRNLGLMIQKYPTVLGSDAAGTVAVVGPNVTTLAVGDRVMGLATGFFTNNHPDYGAMQGQVLVKATNLSKIPDQLDFQEAALMPIALVTTFSGLRMLGIDHTKPSLPSDKQAVLVHGASSSVGSVAVQVARQLGYTVFATASPKHHAMVQRLGASWVFDYKDGNASDAIAVAAKSAGVSLTKCFLANGSRDLVYNALGPIRGNAIVQVAHAPPIRGEIEVPEGFKVTFIVAPEDPAERDEHFGAAFAWLQEKLANGAVVPSPSMTLIEGGLANVNAGLDKLLGGVSGTKLVISMQ